MCRPLAYLGPPVSLERLLVDPPHSLLHQSWAPRHQRHGTVNADGGGHSLSVPSGVGLAQGGSLVASEPCDDHPGWKAVPDGSVVVATAEDMTVTTLTRAREKSARPGRR